MLESIDDGEKVKRGVMCRLSWIFTSKQQMRCITMKISELRVTGLKIDDPRTKNTFVRHCSADQMGCDVLGVLRCGQSALLAVWCDRSSRDKS